MRFRIAAFALLLCGQGHAAVDCAQTSLAATQKLSTYLLGYGQACVENEAKAQLAKWQISDSEKDVAKLVPKLIAAWGDLAERFQILSTRQPQSSLSQAYSELAKRASKAKESLFSNLEPHKAEFAYGHAAWRLPRSIDITDMRFQPYPGTPGVRVDESADKDCADRTSELCRGALATGKELMLNWRLADGVAFPVSKDFLNDLGEHVGATKKLWDRYLYDSKPMQIFDFVATDLLDGRWKQSDQYPHGFREPPDTQWFLLHLSVGVEQLGAAPDGEEFKPVLVLEVFGANRWREDRRWFPVWGLKHLSGASLAVTYADRAGVRDTGVGPVLTFDNVYSVGLIRYESNTALLFSIDLSNLYREKNQEKYESFKRGVQNKLF